MASTKAVADEGMVGDEDRTLARDILPAANPDVANAKCAVKIEEDLEQGPPPSPRVVLVSGWTRADVILGM
jgi:hypothetical protein